MRNYELVAKLMELPAGATVKFVGIFEDDEMSYNSENETTSIEVEISNIDLCLGNINLMS